jgi:ADP-dependent NAD(P)H-hydrate dehydratase / NAD(P)H-hydrate epimerase
MAIACADAQPTDLFTVAQIRAIEQAALNQLPAGTLMQRAGKAVANAALALLPKDTTDRRILIAVGPGNNGGDALVAALELTTHGVAVSIVMPVAPGQLSSDAKTALDNAKSKLISHIDFSDLLNNQQWDLAIDGLFGIGLTRAVAGEFRALVNYLNNLSCPILAIDVPSGLNADDGSLVGPDGVAVKASTTISFIANKPGLHTLHGRDYAGAVIVNDLDIPRSLFGVPVAELNRPALFSSSMHPRTHASHKGSHGDLFVMGGASGMTGAVLLAARAGAMTGAGRVFAGFLDTAPPFDPVHLELMCRSAHSLNPTRGAIVVGPGMGMSREANDLLARMLSTDLDLVIDADGLNLLAVEPGLQQRLMQRRAATLLTPHPLEAARLLEIPVEEIQKDRLDAAKKLATKFQSVVILKGSGTVIANPENSLVINTTGNPALATAGTGDVLAGLCGSLLAQQWPIWDAALAAVWIHGHAADCMVNEGIGPIGITAPELVPYLRKSLNQLLPT